ncbi:MAG TPA: hypothetical protein VFZ17_09385 [Acidimicrobiia bacterium]|nr:hypothetical protein [Acidimicrobiia bacterium]
MQRGLDRHVPLPGEVHELVGIEAHVVELALAGDVLHVEPPCRAHRVVVGQPTVALQQRVVVRPVRRLAHVRHRGAGARLRPARRRAAGFGVGRLERQLALARGLRLAHFLAVLDQVRGPVPRRAVRFAREPEQGPTVVGSRAGHARHRLERRREVDVAGEALDVLARRDPRTAHEQRHVDVGLVRGVLARGKPVLAEVEPVVGAEHEVGVVELALLAHRLHQPGDLSVHVLERLHPTAVEVVDRVLRRRTQARQATDERR